MLTGLSIRNVVLIDALSLELQPGLSALTGETGAGKSIILDALGMATGARSDRGLIRAGMDKAQCTASFHLPLGHKVWHILGEAGVDIDAGEDLILRRTIGADGRSRAFINDAAISVKLLNQIGGHLLEVHGQHDGRGLMDVATHIDMLDSFGDHSIDINKTNKAFGVMTEMAGHLAGLCSRRDKAAEDADFLDHAIAEIDRLDPQDGEDAALTAERRFLQGAEGALSELSAAEEALGEDGAFEDRLGRALAGIERVQAKFPDLNDKAAKALAHAGGALEKAMLETQEAREAVREAAYQFDIEPGRLEVTEKRLFALRAAARKFDVPLKDLPVLRARFAESLAEISNLDAEIIKAQQAADKAELAYERAADKLTHSRKQSAKALSKAVMLELPPLKMERANFGVSLDTAPDSAKGRDKIRFEVSTNPGTPMGPLEKIASGGEMARFALAIKVALAARTSAVMVFDEVDQGVGGAVADAVGRRLARLSTQAQVFVVTHSAQVAARADHQFLIQKSSDKTQTTTHVRLIGRDDREEEIARMLAGETVTQEARAAARQLMKAS